MSGPVIKVGKFRVQIRAIASNKPAPIRSPLGAPAIVDTTAPTIPQNLIVTGHTSTSIGIAWDASTDTESGVKEYVVLRAGIQVAIVGAPSTSFTDTGLTASTSYTYTVEARDNALNTSAASSSATQSTDAPPGDTTPPTAPSSLSATGHTTSTISLAWTGSTDAFQADSPLLRAETDPSTGLTLTANQKADLLRELRIDASRKLRPSNPTHWTVGALEVYPGADVGAWTPTAANGWGNDVGGVDAVFTTTRFVAPITADGGTLPAGWSRATGSGDGTSKSTPWTMLQAKRNYQAGYDIRICTGPLVPAYPCPRAADGSTYDASGGAVSTDRPFNIDRGNTAGTASTFGTITNPVRFRADDPLYPATLKWASSVLADDIVKITQSYVIFDGVEPYGNGDNSPSFIGNVGFHQTGTLSDGSTISHIAIVNCRPHHLRSNGVALEQCIDYRVDGVRPWLCGPTGLSNPSGISWNTRNVVVDASSYNGFRGFIVNCIPTGSTDDAVDPITNRTDGNGIIIDAGNTTGSINVPPVLVANNLVTWNGNRGIHDFHCNNVWVVNNTLSTNGLQTNANEPSNGSSGELSLSGGTGAWANNAVNPWQGAGAFGSKPFHAYGVTPLVTTLNNYYVPGRHDDNTNVDATQLVSETTLVFANAPLPANSATAAHLSAPDPNTILEDYRPLSGIKQYIVFRNGTQVAVTTDTAYTDTGLASNTTYTYKVEGVDLAGNISLDSNTVTGTTDPTSLGVTTPAAYGPTISIAPPATLAGGVYVVKSDGKIYDSAGVAIQDFTNKRVLATTTIKSDTAGTRRALNAGLLSGAQFATGVAFVELLFNDSAANFETDSASVQFSIDFQGCSGTLRHFRAVKSAQNSIRLTKSAAGLFCGSNAASWNTSTPDFILEHFTCHAAGGGAGTSVTVKSGRNVRLGGFDTGTQSTPAGIAGWPTLGGVVFDAATKLDLQDVYVDNAGDDARTSLLASSANTYSFMYGVLKRSGIKAATFVNTAGSRPDRPVWFRQANGTQPGAETAVNTTNAGVVADQPVLQNALAQNLVNCTFRDGAKKLMPFEVTKTVFDPATPVSLWTPADVSQVWPNGDRRFINVDAVHGPLGARSSTAAVMPDGTSAIVNKAIVDSTWTHMGGVAADGVLEITDRVFDVGTFDQSVSGLYSANIKNGGIQVQVGASTTITTTTFTDLPVKQVGGAAMTPALWAINASTLGWSDASVLTTAASGTAPTTVTVPAQSWATNDWVTVLKTNGTYFDTQITKISTTSFTLNSSTGVSTVYVGARIVRHADQYGIYTGYIDANLGANGVDTGIGYRRQLSYVGIDTTNNKFLGCRLVPTPTGSTVTPAEQTISNVNYGKVLRIVAGVAETFHPHGMATGETVNIATPALTGSAYTITRVDDFHFLIQGQTAINWNVSGSGLFGTYSPLTTHSYGLTGGETSITLTSPTAGDTVTVDQTTPLVVTQAQLTAFATQGFFKGLNNGAYDDTIITTAATAMGPIFPGGVAHHMTGSGSLGFQVTDLDPVSPAGGYDYTTWPSSGGDRPWVGNKPSRPQLHGVLNSLNFLRAGGTGTDVTLICALTDLWKASIGAGGDNSAPPPPSLWQAQADEAVALCLQLASQNGGSQYVTHLSWYQESKGHVDLTATGWSPNGLPNTGAQGSYPWETDLVTYNPLWGPGSGGWVPNAPGTGTLSDTNFQKYYAYTVTAGYNVIWRTFKNHANPIINTVQIGGNHLGFGGTNTLVNHQFPLGDGATHTPWDFDYEHWIYFLTYATGLDFLSIDYSIVGFNDTTNANVPYVVANHGLFETLIQRVKFFQANHAMTTDTTLSSGAQAALLAAKRTAPVDVIEFYYDVNLPRVNTNYREDEQAMMEALVLRRLLRSGARKLYKWAPQGDGETGNATGDCVFNNKASYWRTTNGLVTGSLTTPTSSQVSTAGLGKKLLAADVAQLFTTNFPSGTQLYSTTSTDPDLVVMGSASKVLVINTNTTASKTVILGGSPHAMTAKSVAVFSTPSAGGPATTLDDCQNVNYGQPTNNCQLNVATGQRVRYIRCTFNDVTVNASGTTSQPEFWDCDVNVTNVPGDYPYDNPSKLGVAGTYDSSNQHALARMMYNNNCFGTAGGARFVWEGTVAWGMHGDYVQGVFDPTSYARNCHFEHGMDFGSPTAGGANGRDGITWSTGSSVMPKVTQGVHGDVQQWYDMSCYLVYASNIITNAHSLWFSQIENGYDYWLGTAAPVGSATVSAAGGFAQVTTSTNHSMNTGDTCRVRVGPSGLVGLWFAKKISNTVVQLSTDPAGASGVPYAGVTTNIDFVHTITINVPGIHRSVWLTTHMQDASDKTRLSPVNSNGNVSMSLQVSTGINLGHPTQISYTGPLLANELVCRVVIHDNIVQTLDGAAGTWLMATPLVAGDYDITGNAWYNFGQSGVALPGGAASPTLL